MNASDWSVIIFAIGGVVSMILLSFKKIKQVDCCCSSCTQEVDDAQAINNDIDKTIELMKSIKYKVSPRVIFPTLVEKPALQQVEEEEKLPEKLFQVDNIV